MTFEESIKVIKENMREGDAKAVADKIGCTKPVVFNALQKSSISDMTATEAKAFDALVNHIAERNQREANTTNLAINLAQSLQK